MLVAAPFFPLSIACPLAAPHAGLRAMIATGPRIAHTSERAGPMPMNFEVEANRLQLLGDIE